MYDEWSGMRSSDAEQRLLVKNCPLIKPYKKRWCLKMAVWSSYLCALNLQHETSLLSKSLFVCVCLYSYGLWGHNCVMTWVLQRKHGLWGHFLWLRKPNGLKNYSAMGSLVCRIQKPLCLWRAPVNIQVFKNVSVCECMFMCVPVSCLSD